MGVALFSRESPSAPPGARRHSAEAASAASARSGAKTQAGVALVLARVAVGAAGRQATLRGGSERSERPERSEDTGRRRAVLARVAVGAARRQATLRGGSERSERPERSEVMAGGQERVLRRRIKTVESTKKITKAMELIAASRIVKAQQRVAAARPYSERITEVIRNLAAGGAGLNHPLLSQRDDIRTVAYVAITADRGLAGGYNNNIIRATERAMRADQEAGRKTKLYVVGKKALTYFRFRGTPIEASFLGVTDRPTYEQAREIAHAVATAFGDEDVDTVEVVYTQFLSAGSQRVVVRRLMPLDAGRLEEVAESAATASYEFEPDPDTILERLLPR